MPIALLNDGYLVDLDLLFLRETKKNPLKTACLLQGKATTPIVRYSPPSKVIQVGPINLGKKLAGKHRVGKPQAAFEEEGDGNGIKER